MGKRRPDADHCANGHDLRICGLDAYGAKAKECTACRRARVRKYKRSLLERCRSRLIAVSKLGPPSAGDG